jgi:hypothetical protein
MSDYMAARDRPIGITLLSILALIGGIGMVALIAFGAFFLIRGDDRAKEMVEAMATIGLPLPLVAGGVVFLAILAIASGIGMLSGTKWGWYLGSFWYAYAIIRNLSALATVYGLSHAMPPDELASSSRTPGYYYTKYAIRLLISFLLYVYFFKANVREYFGLTGASRWKPVVTEIGICVIIVVAVSLAARMM